MSKEEAQEILGEYVEDTGKSKAVDFDWDWDWDWDWDFDWDDEKKAAPNAQVPVYLDSVGKDETVWLGIFDLSEGDRIQYDVSAESGNGMAVGFLKLGEEDSGVSYLMVSTVQERGELQCASHMTVKAPVEPGRYRLYLKPMNGELGKVTGGVTMALQNPPPAGA